MSSFYSVPATFPQVTGEHQALPVKDSWYCERTQHPARLTCEFDYPVIAVCKACHGRIRLAERAQMEWTHVPAS